MLTLKALEEGLRSSEAILLYHFSNVKTISNLERQVKKLPAFAENLRKGTSLHAVR